MRHKKRLTAVVLSLSLTFAALCPAVQALGDTWERGANSSYIGYDGSAITGITARGIDVSHWKQSVDWNAVAADDIQFVMLGTRYNNAVDPYFDTNAKGAYSAGLRIGAYLYSYATTTAMAEQEADFVLNLIKDYPISYPVVMDVEAAEMSSLTPAQLADIINAFCKKIENAGYYPMIYTNDYWLSNKIDMSKVHYDVWVARYNVKPAYEAAAMWQATNEGQVNGISGNVDINFAFKNFAEKLPANRWRLINGQWYYYKNYVKQTGWIHDGQGWYYLNGDGTQYKGWLLLNNEYYYLLPSTGQMKTGWVQIEDQWYYLKDDGRMAHEWLQADGKYYYLLNGAMVTGWLRIGSDYYYMKGDGSMVTSWRKMDNAYYFFNTDGRLVRGWADIDGERYYMKTDGTMVTGWQTIDNLLYYFDADGALASGWEKISNEWYYFNSDGRMMTGWIQLDGSYYYLHTDGRMVTGWQSDGTNKYYMDPTSGKVSVGWKKIDNVWYYFNPSGHMITGWLNLDGKYYYLNPSDGKMISNGSFAINGVNYTFDGNGVCQNEASAIDGGSAGSIYTSPSGNSGSGNVTNGNSVPGNNSNLPGSGTNNSTSGSGTIPNYSTNPGQNTGSSNLPGGGNISVGGNGMSAGGITGNNSSSAGSIGNQSGPSGNNTGSGSNWNSNNSGTPGSSWNSNNSGTPGSSWNSNNSGTTSTPGSSNNSYSSGSLNQFQTGGPK